MPRVLEVTELPKAKTELKNVVFELANQTLKKKASKCPI